VVQSIVGDATLPPINLSTMNQIVVKVNSSLLSSKVTCAMVTKDIRIIILSDLPTDAHIHDSKAVVNYASRGLEGVAPLYDWSLHRLTSHIGYTTYVFSDTGEQMSDVFEHIVEDFSSDEEGTNDSYPEKNLTQRRAFF
jgi:hypothetical protein